MKWRLLTRDLSRSKKKLSVVTAAVALGVSLVVLFGSVGLGLYRGVLLPLLPRLPLNSLEVKPKTVAVGFLAFEGGELDASVLERLRRIQGVTAAYPVLGAAFPMLAEGGEGFLGKRMRTDLFATGIAPGLVQADVFPGKRFEDRSEGPVPVLVSRRLLELYNSTVSRAIDKPKLSAEAVVGFQFQLVLGASYARGTPDPSQVQTLVAEIVGFSDHATMVGVTVPEATMIRWNQRYGKESPLTSVHLQLQSPSDAGPVSSAVEQLGLLVDETPKLVGTGLAIGAGLGGLFAAVLLLLAGFGIAQSFFLLVAERRMELSILRALGARRRDVFRLVMFQALLVGLLGGLLGTLLGMAVGLGLERWVLGHLPALPFVPDRLIAWPPSLLLGATVLGLLSAALGAWFPAQKAAGADPGASLRA